MLNQLSEWDTSKQLSPYKTPPVQQGLEGITGLLAMLKQQQQDKALRQAAGQLMGGKQVPMGVNAGDLYSKLAVEKAKPMNAGSILDQIELQNVMNGLKKTATPPVADTLGGAVPPQTPGAAVLGAGQDTGVPPMFVPGKKNKYGVQEEIDNPAFSLYQKAQEEKMKPPTDAQSTASLYATRMEEANKVFDQFPEVSIGTAMAGTPLVPNFMKSEQAQSMEQAKRNFLNAVLRKESGAVISPSEFKQGNLQYFPVQGDRPETLALKKQNRQTAIEGLKKSAGKAYTGVNQSVPTTTAIPQKKNTNDLASAALVTGAGAAGLGGLAYGASKVIPKVAEGVKHIPTVMSTAKEAEFAKSMNKAFTQEHTKQVAKFGAALDKLATKNPQASIDLSEFVGEIIKPDSTINPQAMAVFKKVPKLADMMANPELAKTVSIRDAQDIINYLNTKVPKNIKVNNFDLLDAINTVKAEQLQAFPEMSKVRANYAKFIEPYKNIKRYFGFNKTLPAIKGEVPFGGAQGWEAAKEILPAKTIKSMKGFRMASQVKEGVTAPGKFIGKALGMGGRALSAGPSLLQAFILKQQLDEAKKKGGFKIGLFGDIVPTSKEDLML